jgi:hypothetical protein
MPTATYRVSYYLVYTGSNSVAIIDHLNQYNPSPGVPHTWGNNGEAAGVLTVGYDNGGDDHDEHVINTGDYVIADPNDANSSIFMTPADYADLYRDQPIIPAVTLAAGSATVPSLIANAQTTVAVDLNVAFPNTSYTPVAFLSGGVSLLASLSILSTTIVDADTVNVVVKNTGLITLAGATVTVVATA